MQFRKTLGTACSTFALTNIDDLFVLATFFTESSVNKNLTPLKITIGQYLGFSIIMLISMIGYAVAQAIPSEPIGFLGLLPMLLGVWKVLGLMFPNQEEEPDNEVSKAAGMRNIFKVASISVMNGGDNIGTYIPLFSQAKGPEIAVYVVTYYILLGIWCLIGFLIIKQKHVLAIAQKYAGRLIPFLYIGLGIFIVVESGCYPWSIKEIDDRYLADPGETVMAIMTTFFLLAFIGAMFCFKWQARLAYQDNVVDASVVELQPNGLITGIERSENTVGEEAGGVTTTSGQRIGF
ncbi:hypothetical protein TWF281_009726 [Arthrobotrys megalospora]